MSDWWSDLTANWLPSDPPPKPSKRSGLAAKHDAVLRLRPGSICEIGVRAGYSAFAMLSAAPHARFLGIDAGADYYGDPGPLRAHSVQLLARFPHASLLWADSHDLVLLATPFDLVHIDGDHTEAGCYADLDLALRSECRHAMVDDVDYIPSVRTAVERFASDNELFVEWIEDGHHGTAILHLRC